MRCAVFKDGNTTIKNTRCYPTCVANCVTHSQKLRNKVKKGTKKALKNSVFQCFFGLSDKLTNLVLRRLFWLVLTVQEREKRANSMAFAKM